MGLAPYYWGSRRPERGAEKQFTGLFFTCCAGRVFRFHRSFSGKGGRWDLPPATGAVAGPARCAEKQFTGLFFACFAGRILQVPSTLQRNKNTILMDGVFIWCGRWDLNPYGLPYAPQTYASAYSATTAYTMFRNESYYT